MPRSIIPETNDLSTGQEGSSTTVPRKRFNTEEILPNQKDQRGKWAPNWDGSYVVKKAFTRGELILTKMDGNDLPSPINSNAVKKYYA